MAACSWSGGVVKGRVLDYQTNKPIPGAIVFAYWEGHMWAVVESQTVCIHLDTTVSDDQGRYHFGAWRKPATINFVTRIHPYVLAYKPGYGDPQGIYRQPEGITYLAPFTGTREARLKYLSIWGSRTGWCERKGEDYANKLIPLYRALYSEGKSIAVTKDEKRRVSHLHYWLDSLELGDAEADKKLHGGEYESAW